ncbi:MAG: hypothetical protein ACR2JB_00940 [Bryobacteraceae bacterium]
MDDPPLPRLTHNDPKNCLDEAARWRIQAAHWEGATLRQRVFAELELEYRSKKNPEFSFSEYVRYGDGAVRMSQASMEHARLVLRASVKEYKAAGKSRGELHRIIEGELEGAVNSLGLSIAQRDLLSMELNAPSESLGTLTQQQSPTRIESSTLNARQAFILPLLENKGWSVFDWANESEVAHATAMDFLDGKTKVYSSTRAKLAKALGIPVEQLPK